MSVPILAIESSQREMAVAMRGRDGAVHVEHALGDPRESDQLLPAIDRLVQRAGWSPSSLAAVAVSSGPGGFTGLRVSIATAKGICEARAIPAIDVPTALVAAHATLAVEPVVAEVALACKGDGFWSTTVRCESGAWSLVEESAAHASAWSPRGAVLVADSHLPAAARERAQARGVRIIEPQLTAEACLAAAEAKWRAGETVDSMLLAPRYARQPEAVTLWQARHGTPA